MKLTTATLKLSDSGEAISGKTGFIGANITWSTRPVAPLISVDGICDNKGFNRVEVFAEVDTDAGNEIKALAKGDILAVTYSDGKDSYAFNATVLKVGYANKAVWSDEAMAEVKTTVIFVQLNPANETKIA